jgi:hypothetical protein
VLKLKQLVADRVPSQARRTRPNQVVALRMERVSGRDSIILRVGRACWLQHAITHPLAIGTSAFFAVALVIDFVHRTSRLVVVVHSDEAVIKCLSTGESGLPLPCFAILVLGIDVPYACDRRVLRCSSLCRTRRRRGRHAAGGGAPGGADTPLRIRAAHTWRAHTRPAAARPGTCVREGGPPGSTADCRHAAVVDAAKGPVVRRRRHVVAVAARVPYGRRRAAGARNERIRDGGAARRGAGGGGGGAA